MAGGESIMAAITLVTNLEPNQLIQIASQVAQHYDFQVSHVDTLELRLTKGNAVLAWFVSALYTPCNIKVTVEPTEEATALRIRLSRPWWVGIFAEERLIQQARKLLDGVEKGIEGAGGRILAHGLKELHEGSLKDRRSKIPRPFWVREAVKSMSRKGAVGIYLQFLLLAIALFGGSIFLALFVDPVLGACFAGPGICVSLVVLRVGVRSNGWTDTIAGCERIGGTPVQSFPFFLIRNP